MPTVKDIVIGLDSSTQSAKAVAWDKAGTALATGTAPIALDQSVTGRAEQTSADWWTSACTALSQVTAQIDPARIAAVSISNQRETIGFFDADFVEIHPAVTWLDDRALEEIENLTSQLGADRLHNITGRPPFDATVAVHTLAWMKRHKLAVWAKLGKVLDVHGFLTHQLTGHAVASTTSIDAFSVYNIHKMQLSQVITDHLGLDEDNFAEVQKPGSVAGHITAQASGFTGLPQGVPVIVAGGDGQCAGLGVRAITPGAIYLNLGTAIIAGSYAEDPLISQYWRTVTSPTSEGYFLEGCQRAGTFLIDWLCREIGGRSTDAASFTKIEVAAANLPIGSDGVTISPYLMGCMDPYWNREARANIMGLSPQHSFVHLFRASLEATALQIARYIAATQSAGLTPDHIVAVGGGSTNALWTQMIADACGLPIVRCQSTEASSLGAAITAAVGIGWFDSFEGGSNAMVSLGSRMNPNTETKSQWDRLSQAQARTYVIQDAVTS